MKKHLPIITAAVLAAAPAVLFGWLAWQELVPGGTFRAAWEPGERSSFIDPIRPDQRVLPPSRAGGERQQAVVGDPVYTFLHPHRHFDAVSLEIRFRNEGVPIIEAGGLVQAGPDEIYDLHPVDNLLIDGSAWPRLEEDGYALLQRQPTYASVDAFFQQPPPPERMATYRCDRCTWEGSPRLLPELDLDAAGVDFVIARYETPRQEGSWKVATVDLDPSKMLAQRGAWKVVLSAPGAGKDGRAVVVNRLEATFRRDTLREELRKRMPWL